MCSGVPTWSGTRRAFCSDQAFAKLQLKRRTDVLELRARNTVQRIELPGAIAVSRAKWGSSVSISFLVKTFTRVGSNNVLAMRALIAHVGYLISRYSHIKSYTRRSSSLSQCQLPSDHYNHLL